MRANVAAFMAAAVRRSFVRMICQLQPSLTHDGIETEQHTGRHSVPHSSLGISLYVTIPQQLPHPPVRRRRIE